MFHTKREKRRLRRVGLQRVRMDSESEACASPVQHLNDSHSIADVALLLQLWTWGQVGRVGPKSGRDTVQTQKLNTKQYSVSNKLLEHFISFWKVEGMPA